MLPHRELGSLLSTSIEIYRVAFFGVGVALPTIFLPPVKVPKNWSGNSLQDESSSIGGRGIHAGHR